MSKKQLGTPVMRQFWEMKKNNPDSILLFRMGDFYETFEIIKSYLEIIW